MSRRLATVILHWSALTLLLLLLAAGGRSVLLTHFFGGTGLAMVGLAMAKGVMIGPEPKLQGASQSAPPVEPPDVWPAGMGVIDGSIRATGPTASRSGDTLDFFGVAGGRSAARYVQSVAYYGPERWLAAPNVAMRRLKQSV